MSDTTSVSLTDAQLALLDGHCDGKVKAEVDAALRRIAEAGLHDDPKLARFISDVLNEARTTNLLVYKYRPIRICGICGAYGGYETHARNSRYHRKGETNHNKPIPLPGREFKDSFVSMEGYVSLGGCQSCIDAALPTIKQHLRDIRAQIPDALRDGHPELLRFEYVTCKECGWTGPKCCLRSLPAVIEGSYFGGCPSCAAENRWLCSTKIETVSGKFIVVEKSLLKLDRNGLPVGLLSGITQGNIEGCEAVGDVSQ